MSTDEIRPKEHLMKNAATVARNATWLTLQPIAMGIVSVMVTALVARSLGTENYGVLILLLSYAALFSPLSNLGLRPYSVREIAADRTRALAMVEDMLVLRFGLALLAAIVAASYVIWSDQHISGVLIIILFTQLVLNALAGCFIDGLYGIESMKAVASVMGAAGLIVQMACLAAVLMNAGLEGVAWAYTAGSAASLIISWRIFRRKVGAFKLHMPHLGHYAHIRNSWAFLFQNLVGTIRQRIDVVLVNSLLGPHAAGIYGSSLTLIQRVDLIQDGITTALFPRVAELHKRSPGELKKLVQGAFKISLLISLPIAVGLFGTAGNIIQLIFGSQYQESASVLVILGTGLPFMFVYGVVANVLGAMHMQRVVLNILIMVTVLSIVYMVVGINLAGIHGAAAAYVLGYATFAIAGTIVYWRTMGPPMAPLDAAGIVLANCVMGFLLWTIKDFGLAAKIFLCSLVYAGTILGVRVVTLTMLKTIFIHRPSNA
jgi:O-antigen/teichoic acid export membrane protein